MQFQAGNYSNLVELLSYRAQTQSSQTAYTFLKDGETNSAHITYQQLDEQARAIAAQLQSLTVSGSRVLMLYPYDAGLEFIAAFFGCLYAGVVAVPTHIPRNRHALDDLQARLADSQANVILTTKNLLTKLKNQLTTPESPQQFHNLLWLTTDNISTQATNYLATEISSDTLAFLQYTSGSTGMPKGVMITHECLLHSQQMLKIAFGHTARSIGVGWLPLFHDMGLIGNVIQALYLGSPCIFISPIAFVQKPLRWLQAISSYKATTSGAPNFAYELLCRHVTPQQRESLDLSSWEVAFCGAEPIRAETIERFVATFAPCGFRREAFYPCYGMAEATLLISGGKKTAPPVIKYVDKSALEQNSVVPALNERVRPLVGCGQAWLDEKIVIVDPELLTECSANSVGEIWVSSSGIGKGYWNQPQETVRTFNAHLNDTQEGPFLRTGDLGFLQDGELFITGRINDVLVFWGFNHYPQHIEQTVEKCHPAFRANCSAAFSVDVEGEERLVVVQEVERNYRHLQVDEVVEAIRWAIFEQHFVDLYAFVLLKTGSIPKTSSGKIQRRTCRAKFIDQSLDIIGEWRSPQGQKSDITSLINRYLNPITHANRYFTSARGRLRRLLYTLPTRNQQSC